MKKNEIANNNKLLNALFNNFLNKPGDEVSARVTKTGRKVIKAQKNNGRNKISQTVYSNGTKVTTITEKIK